MSLESKEAIFENVKGQEKNINGQKRQSCMRKRYVPHQKPLAEPLIFGRELAFATVWLLDRPKT
jgi:hypothetical protein